MTDTSVPGNSDPLFESFAGILMGDVANVMHRYDADPSPQSRRELIRTLFAAIEGYTWLYREHVIEAAKSMEALTLEEEIALSEVSYQVTEQGKIVSQQRYLSMLAAFRLTTQIATRLNLNLSIRFDTGEWERLRSAIGVRNRITHPKSRTDLEISDLDLAAAQGAFFWLLDTVMGAMEAANAALRQYNIELRAILAELRDGYPAILAKYRAAPPDS